MLDNMNEYDLELCECTRLISNTFTINSAGISPATRQREQQARGIRGRLNMAPQIVNFDTKCDSPGKENMGEEDISFYTSHSPAASPRTCHTSSPSIYAIEKTLMRCNSQDSTSMDSGYSGLHPDSNNMLSSSIESSSAFAFLKPSRPTSESFMSNHRTPPKYTVTSGGSYRIETGFKAMHGLSPSMQFSDPDDFMELMEMENMDEDTQLPTGVKSLFNENIESTSRTPDMKHPQSYARKCLNMDTLSASGGAKSLLFGSPRTPKSSTITSLITTPERQCLGTLSQNITPFRGTTAGFKRPEPPSAIESPVQSKRLKFENETFTSSSIIQFSKLDNKYTSQTKRPAFRKSVSMNDAAIMNALARSTTEPNLIGDCSLPFSLPLVESCHADLKSITETTMRKLILGEFSDSIASYRIIDCRFPYEFEGGHIRGAMNLYTQEQIIEELVKNKTETPTITAGDQKRHILIFHCEFSSERGPKLYRFLRNHDRTKNANLYPALHYPEIYLLHKGYKEFYATNSDLCSPNGYRPMKDEKYSDEYKECRAKSKSWGGDVRGPGTVRLTKSRSRLVL